jgi:DNA-binding transcriptional LysR family regulator
MNNLDNLQLFIRIVEKGGLAAAGRDFGLSPATVSERLVALEAHYKARLLNRTTRAISLTDAGQMLVDGARNLICEANDLQARIRLGIDQLSGLIRLSAPMDLGRTRIAPLLDEFMQAHPDIRVDLTLTDSQVDLVAQGLDLAVRLGTLSDSSLISRKLENNYRHVVAANSYLEQYGTPASPQDLDKHNCLVMRFGSSIDNEWPFQINGRAVRVPVYGNRIANDGSLVREWCRQGLGIAFKSGWDVAADIESGALVRLLDDFAAMPSSIQLVYPSARTLPNRVRKLIDFFAADFLAADVAAIPGTA